MGRLPFARSLIGRARGTGEPATGLGRSRQGEPFPLATVVDERGRAFVAGRAVDRGLLAGIERPTGVLVRLETFGSARVATPPGTRQYEWPLPLDDGSRLRLQVSVASDALRAATLSSLLLVVGAGAPIVAWADAGAVPPAAALGRPAGADVARGDAARGGRRPRDPRGALGRG